MNFYSLAYMLLAEAILFTQHKWYEIYEGCHYCQIEKYHMIILRTAWHDECDIYMFLDEDLANLIKDKALPMQVGSLLNPSGTFLGNLMTFQFKFCDLMVERFFNINYPFQVKSLKDLCEFQIIMGVLIKKLEAMDKWVLQHQVFTSSSERDPKYIRAVKQLNKQIWHMGNQYKGQQWIYEIKGQQYIYDHPHLLDSFKRIISKTNRIPLQCHHTMAKLSDSFKRMGRSITSQYDYISPMI